VYCKNSPTVLTDQDGLRTSFPSYSESSAKEMAKEGYYWKDDMWARGNAPYEKSQPKTPIKPSDTNKIETKQSVPEVSIPAEETKGSGAGGYLSKSLKSALLGDFSNEQTALSIGINIAIGFTPLGIAADIRDFAGSAAKGDAMGMVFAGIGFIPVVGDVAKGLRKAEKVVEGAGATGKVAGSIADAAKYSDEMVDVYKNAQLSGKVLGKSTGSASEILRKELNAAGIPNPGYATRAHHIVEATDMSQAAQESRKILGKLGIDLNSAANGVLLPFERGVVGAGNAAVHRGRHMNSYSEAVRDALKEGNPQTANDAMAILQDLRTMLLKGELQLHR
jgi:hypothetical protein